MTSDTSRKNLHDDYNNYAEFADTHTSLIFDFVDEQIKVDFIEFEKIKLKLLRRGFKFETHNFVDSLGRYLAYYFSDSEGTLHSLIKELKKKRLR